MKAIAAETGICHFRVGEPCSLSQFLWRLNFAPLEIQPDLPKWFEYGCVYVDGRRQCEDMTLAEGQIVRVHTRPKSYARPSVSLKTLLVEDNADFLVFDKPAGLPTHPTLDNFVENA